MPKEVNWKIQKLKDFEKLQKFAKLKVTKYARIWETTCKVISKYGNLENANFCHWQRTAAEEGWWNWVRIKSKTIPCARQSEVIKSTGWPGEALCIENFLSALFSMKTATKRMESDPNWYKVIFKTGKKLSQMLFGAPPKQIMRNISDYMDRNPYNHIIIFQWYIYNCSCMYGSKIFLGPPWGGKYNLGHGQQ